MNTSLKQVVKFENYWDWASAIDVMAEKITCPICGNGIGQYGPGYKLGCQNGNCPSWTLPENPFEEKEIEKTE